MWWFSSCREREKSSAERGKKSPKRSAQIAHELHLSWKQFLTVTVNRRSWKLSFYRSRRCHHRFCVLKRITLPRELSWKEMSAPSIFCSLVIIPKASRMSQVMAATAMCVIQAPEVRWATRIWRNINFSENIFRFQQGKVSPLPSTPFSPSKAAPCLKQKFAVLASSKIFIKYSN